MSRQGVIVGFDPWADGEVYLGEKPFGEDANDETTTRETWSIDVMDISLACMEGASGQICYHAAGTQLLELDLLL